jgi:zinc protease
MGKISILPIGDDADKREAWMASNLLFEKQKQDILQNHVRTVPVEEPLFVHSLPEPELFDYSFPRATRPAHEVAGSQVVSFFDDTDPLVQVIFSLKDTEALEGSKEGILLSLMFETLLEGSCGYTKKENIDFLDLLGTNYSFGLSSAFTVLNVNFLPAMKRFVHILKKPCFRKDALEKQKEIMVSALNCKKDSQQAIASRQLKQILYAGSVFDWSLDDAMEAVKSCSVKDIVDLHSKYLNPENLIVGVAGNVDVESFDRELEVAFKGWQSGKFERDKSPLPSLSADQEPVDLPMLRDQVIFVLGGPSEVSRYHSDREALTLANIIVFQSLGCRIFQLRERTGLFYTAGGGFPFTKDRQAGENRVLTILNPDKVEEGERGIRDVLKTVVEAGITEVELKAAKQSMFNSLISGAHTKGRVISGLIGLEDIGFDPDHYDKMWEKAKNLTVEDVNTAIKKHYKLDEMVRIRVGNLAEKSAAA